MKMKEYIEVLKISRKIKKATTKSLLEVWKRRKITDEKSMAVYDLLEKELETRGAIRYNEKTYKFDIA